MKKKIVSLLVSFAMAFALIPLAALSAYAADADEGYTTDEHGLIEYKIWNDGVYGQYEIFGYVDEAWRQVTCLLADFRKLYGFKAGVYNNNGSLTISHTPTFIADGRALQIDYTVKNASNEKVSDTRFFVAADTMIAGNDNSINSISNGAVIMTDPDTNISFFAMSPTEGGTPVATSYSQEYHVANEGVDPSTVTSVETTTDSAFVTYFPLTEYAAGEEKTFSLIVGMGTRDEIDDIIDAITKKTINASIDYPNETIKALEASASHEITIDGDESATTYKFTSSESGTIPLAGTDENNVAYDFIGKKISIVAKGDGETTEDSNPQTIEVAARPEPTITATPAEHKITVTAKDGYEYSIDGGTTWVSQADDDGNIVFDNLDAYTDYTISYRIPATQTAPKSLTKTQAVKTLCEHDAGDDWVTEDDADTHWHTCTICGTKMDEEAHEYSDDWVTTDDTNHWHECTVCGHKKDEAAHTDNDNNHKCDTCDKTISECVAGDEWSTDETNHWHVCTICNAIMDEENHVDENDDHKCDVCEKVISTCIDENPKDHLCDICGNKMSECGVDVNPADHKCDYCGKVVSTCLDEDPKDHYCDICGDKLTDCTASAEWTKDETNHWRLCTICGATMDKDEHKFDTEWTTGDKTHWYECSVCGYKKDEAAHSGGTATCQEKAKCEICGEEYGELSRTNHAGLTYVEAKKATTTSKGNTGYWYCKYCDKYYTDADATNEITKAETIIPKLTSDDETSTSDDEEETTDTSDNETPQTGDDANMMLLFVLLLTSGSAVAVITRRKKKFDRQ